MKHRYEMTSLEGLVQYLAANILPHGYWFHVAGRVPDGKDPYAVDRKLIEKFEVGLSRQQRARRKAAGLANVQYVRLGRLWLMLATHGAHSWFEEHTRVVVDPRTGKEKAETLFQDARRTPLQVGGYSLWVKRGHYLLKRGAEAAQPDGRWRVRVLISRERYKALKAYFLDIACHRSVESLARELWNIPFEPYAPIRRQLLVLLRLVNEKRQAAGFAKVPSTCLRFKRRIVCALEPALDQAALTTGPTSIDEAA